MPIKHPIEDLISSVYQLIEQKDNENLDIAFKRLCAEFNAISQERTPYMINLQFQAMAAIVRSQPWRKWLRRKTYTRAIKTCLRRVLG